MTTVEIDGLKDMIACNTRISSIIDDHLSYAGYDICCGMVIFQRKWNSSILRPNYVRTMIFQML